MRKSFPKINKRRRKTIAGIMAIVLLTCVYPSFPVYADKVSEVEQRLKEEKDKKKDTENKIGESQNELDSLRNTTNGLKGELSDLNDNLEEVSANLDDLEGKIAAKNEEIERTQAELEEAKQIEADQYAAMKKRIQFMYERQDYVLMETLFSSANYSELLNRSAYIESLAAYDRKQLEAFKQTRIEVEETEARLQGEMKDLEALKAEVEAEQSRVSGLVSSVRGKISGYQSDMAQTEDEIKAYEQQLADQNANIQEIQKQLEEERRLSALAAKSAWRDISEVTFAEGDRYLLANLIYCEAGNQPYEGQVAVGAVVMNRVMSSVFPDTIVGVIYQNRQFEPVSTGRLALALARDDATSACYQAADAAMGGQTTVGNCLFFRTPIEGLTGQQIGGHIFY